jgi:hypothetical protein
MKTPIPRLTLRAVGLGVAALALTLGGATAALSVASDEGVITACRHRSGLLLVPSPGKACKQAQQTLTWNVRGPAGPAGPQGPAGPAGTVAEIDSVDVLDGIACTTSDDAPGTVSLETEVDGAIVLTCEAAAARVDYLDEAARISADLVVVDLVDHESRRRGRRRRSGSSLAREHDRAVHLRFEGHRSLCVVARGAGDAIEHIDRVDLSDGSGRPGGSLRTGRACRAAHVPGERLLRLLAGLSRRRDEEET